MKAVLTFMAVAVLTACFLVGVQAAEPEISMDLFWGNGDLTVNEPDNSQAPDPEKPALEKGIINHPEPTPSNTEQTPTHSAEPTPVLPVNSLLSAIKKTDLKGVFLGLRYPIERFRLGIECGFGQEDGDNSNGDFGLWGVKAGYSLAEGARGWIEPYAGYLDLQAGGFDVSGPVIGVDFRYQLTSRFSLDGGAGLALGTSLQKDSSKYNQDESLKLARVKLIYHLNQRWDLGLGYRSYRFAGENSGAINDKVDAAYDLYTLGFAVKLGRKTEPTPLPTPEPTPELTPTPAITPSPTPETPTPTSTPTPEPTPLPTSPLEVSEVSRLLKPIFFDFDKSNLRPDQKLIMDQNIAILHDHPDLAILVGGHADYRGKKAYNVKLSKRRAKTVTDYLVKQGINSERIYIFAYGEIYPYNKYHQNSAWESDRWVDLLVTESEPTWEMGVERRGEQAELK